MADDAYLDVALDGVRLIEASAGTGKTFTLATLVTRLVVERDLRLGQILAVTFTEAATQELRARLRQRLALAATMAAGFVAAPAGSASAASGDSAEAEVTRRIIQRQLRHEDATSLQARLQRAEREIDLASVFTIHAFCARVLSEHALQTGQAFEPPQLIGSERELHDELAADLWRAHGANARDAESLQALWSGPQALASDLGLLLRSVQLLPAQPEPTPDPLPQLQHAFDHLCTALAEHGARARADLDAAIVAKHIDGRKARAASYAKAWESLVDGIASASLRGDAAHLDKLTPTRLRECAKAGSEDRLPASPLFDALADWFAAGQQRQQWLAAQSLRLVHELRAQAAQRLAQLKRTRRVQSFDDLIDGVADALASAHGAALATGLRRQYAIALVDEFQDTDARQWAIFRRVFGDEQEPDAAPALFLIGDPKQAIYGFRGGDVHTYLAAKRDARIAPPLTHNFRSRPGVLRAIAALYRQAGDTAFVDERIRFHAVEPGAGNRDTDYLRRDMPAPAMTVRSLPASADGKPYKADDSRALAAQACVAAIHGVLADARAGRALIDGDPVEPGDIAVLVRSHVEATRMQAALVAAGIAAVAAGRQSLFETAQALELLVVFEALLQPADEGRLRAALATPLLGIDGAGIARLDDDDAWRRDHQQHALQWRERWQRHGPLALVADLCAANAERLLRLADGERRLTNLLQLGELLQEADARMLGLHGLVDWLRRQIAEADANDEQQLLRLESDARRVQILTLHKSKGLEFPLVFLPFAGIGRKDDPPSRHCVVPGETGAVLHWKLGRDDDSPRWQEAVQAREREQRAEDARLLYVGLTRAEHAIWLATGPLYQATATPLAPMLADLDALRAQPDIVIDAAPLQRALPPLPPAPTCVVDAARQARRVLSRDWWVYSFTQLAKADTGSTSAAAIAGERGAEDEPEALSTVLATADGVASDRRFGGSRFGNVLHDALEHCDFHAWRDWRGGDAPPGQDAVLRDALRGGGYADADLDDGIAELAALAGHTLTVALPEGGRLCDLPDASRRAELEFHFALQPTRIDDLLALLHAHGVVPERQSFGLRRQLEGLMTGKIDLTYHADGRWYLLDYKSNRLPGYDAASLDQAMAHSEYDLQALIYTVALHRWLRFRLVRQAHHERVVRQAHHERVGYDYARDFGGVRYLFCRGLDATRSDSPGIHARRFAPELVHALDGLFDGRDMGASA
nr:exodeoxyribonuclease V subunit beta [Luteimonas cucumeris]